MLGTTDVLDRLREEGYDISHSYVAYLLRERIVHLPEKGPGGALIWLPTDIAALRRELGRRGRGPVEREEGGLRVRQN
jgi:hypothetical protein